MADGFSQMANNVSVHGLHDVPLFQIDAMMKNTLAIREHLQHHLASWVIWVILSTRVGVWIVD